MSATQDVNAANAAAGSGGEFSSRVKPSEPLTTTGHQPGSINGPKDAAPTFSAEAYPPGTAPKANTFTPNVQNEAPQTTANAAETITGATSADVHEGLGHPGQGQSSHELRHDGKSTRAKQTSGLEGVGAGSAETRLPGDRVPGMATGTGTGIDAHADPSQRGLDREGAHEKFGVGETGSTPAQERIPESAETVAREATS